MNPLMSVIIFAIVTAHLVLIAFAQLRSQERNRALWWLSAAILFSALAALSYLLPAQPLIGPAVDQGVVVILTLLLMFAAFGALVNEDLTPDPTRQQWSRYWLGINGVWLGILVVTVLVSDTTMLGDVGWIVDLFNQPDAAALVALVGLVVTGVLLLAAVSYHFYRARLPEVSSRALFWMLNLTLLILGVLLVGSGTELLASLGLVMLLSAMIGGTYAVSSHRVLDIQRGMILSLRTLSVVGIAAALIFLTLYLTVSTDLETDPSGLLVMGILALGIGALYIPLRQLVEFLIRMITANTELDPTQATRDYSRVVSTATSLEELVTRAVETLNRVLRVRSSCVILFNNTFRERESLELLVKHPDKALDSLTGLLSLNSPVYTRAAVSREPFSQFDLEYGPDFREVPEEEKAFFRKTGMRAYAPILQENSIIGLLACGPKLNNSAFYPRDLELLSTFAQQTGIALRNARLVDDLQHLNKSMQSLNKTLKNANEQLEQMDSVKSDFVTIASHELRTPLAQIRGYTDIVDALNEQGMLDKDQTNGLVLNLRKATERMEELISAMLDVSQLDIEAMDLRFTQTSAESVVRMAIEPLTDAIKQRKLTLSARGLRGLPTIQADLQRLVQAFRNVIVNAIKFTPDGGRIEIVASLEEAPRDGDTDKILIQIRDTGVGIDQHNLQAIFNKFFRAYDPALHSTGTYKFMGAGPGLGLTIAKGVIEGHGGKIWAESTGHDMEAKPGATFFILLPVSRTEAPRRVSFEAETSTNSTVDKDEATATRSPIESGENQPVP